ncbi:MAG: site-specific integrase [Marinagarivorans sp.]
MLIKKLAEEYAAITYFVAETERLFLCVTDLFIQRSGIETFDKLDLDAVIRFKSATLEVAKPVTFNGYLKYLRVLGDYAVKNGHLEKNHFRTLKTAPAGKKLFRVLDNEPILRAIDILRQNTDEYPDAAFWIGVIKTLYYTGMRRRQLAALQVGDIKCDQDIIILSCRGSKTHREWTIPIHAQLKPAMEGLLHDLRHRLGRPLKDSDPVFNFVFVGKPYKPDPLRPNALQPKTISDFFKRFKKKTGIHLSAHRFRHTFATNLCNPEEGDPDILVVQQLLGHTTLATTKEYVHTKLERMAKAIERLSLGR